MANSDIYRQVKLARTLVDGRKITEISWIPNEFAKVDRILKIKNSNGEWIDGWKVIETYNSTTFEYLDNQRKVHKRFAEVLEDH